MVDAITVPATLSPPRFSQPQGIAMLFNLEIIVMRILSKRQLKELVLYSPQHIARLEKAGKFPKRIQLGPNRVGWVEREVLDWLEERLAAR
jgi:prophage regulatory protein